MRITYSTVVAHLPPTPLGLLGARWMTAHCCDLCHQRVESDQLIIHTQGHDNVAGALLVAPDRSIRP